MKKLSIGRYDKLKLLRHSLFGRKYGGLVICLWHEFYKPPYGGGNQFMLALKGALEKKGCLVVCNLLVPQVDVHICNSAWFDVSRFEKHAKKLQAKMIHRIDGPVGLYRGEGIQEDIQIHRINAKFASATVYQSSYCLEKSRELGLVAVKPTVIGNSINNIIFHDRGRERFSRKRKIKIISSSWSDNPLKGGPLYKWLDGNIDWNRYEYSFVGRIKQHFNNIKHIPPQTSEELAKLLRQHDIFLSASQHEPCSNALLEALACGLPAVYRNTGGNPELVGKAGLPFDDDSDVLEKLDNVARDYEHYQKEIAVSSIDEIADRYIKLASQVLHSH